MAKKGKSSSQKRNKKPTNTQRSAPKARAQAPKTRKVETTKPSVAPSTATATAKKKVDPVNSPQFGQDLPFGRMNYILMGIGVAVLGLGFVLMGQDSFVDANEFSISLHIAPVIVVAGFIELIFAIMYKDKHEALSPSEE